MFDFFIYRSTIYRSAVCDLVVVKLERMLVYYCAVFLFKQFNEELVIVDWVAVIFELAIGNKIFTVYTEVSFGVGCESTHVKSLNACLNFTSETGLISA